MVKNAKFGADPELFLCKSGKIISAEGLIGGSKNRPNFISDKGHAIQEDNVMIEFNIPPCETVTEFIDEINFVKEYLEQHAKLFDCGLDFSSSAYLEDKYLKTPQAKLFGCEPDLNIYLKSINESPKANTNLRTCGGHIHVGYDNPKQAISEMLVYAMDMTLGLESILLDKDTERRKMYGKAGCFRFKNYGIEYRTLSNFWIRDNKSIEWAFNNTLKAIELVNSKMIYSLVDEFANDVKECIDKSDPFKSRVLLDKITEKINKKVCVEF